MNGPKVYAKVTDNKGLAAQLAASKQSGDQIVEQLYLTVYNRMPESDERAYAASLYKKDGADRRKVTEDILWVMLNTPEFILKD